MRPSISARDGTPISATKTIQVRGFPAPSMMGWLREFSATYVVGLAAVAAIMIAATIAPLLLKLVMSNE